jgi:uncharacterized YigZ family protein
MVHSYHTIESPSEGQYKEKGSRFLAFAYPVNSEMEIKEKLEQLRQQFFDARHHCFAWILGADQSRFRAFDDGEPNHSAGDPILGQIRSRKLTNILVIVVRYFGGTKLGVGGLVTAYKLATADALDKADVVEEIVRKGLSITYEYAATPEIERFIQSFDGKIVQQSFGEQVTLECAIPVKHWHAATDRLSLLVATHHPIAWQEKS